jgi:hypothetical protein
MDTARGSEPWARISKGCPSVIYLIVRVWVGVMLQTKCAVVCGASAVVPSHDAQPSIGPTLRTAQHLIVQGCNGCGFADMHDV